MQHFLSLFRREPRIAVVRSLGGANAGHEVVLGEAKHARHVLPSVYHPNVWMIIAAGTVVHPPWFLEEVEKAVAFDPNVRDWIRISGRATVTMPWDRLEDRYREEALGRGKIGTTQRGIGPSYEGLARRVQNVHFAMLQRPDWTEEYHRLRGEAIGRLVRLYAHLPEEGDATSQVEASLAEIEDGFLDACAEIVQYVVECHELERIYEAADVAILEGNQGLGLHHLFGSRPFVTSAPTDPLSMASAAMLPPPDRVLYVAKCFATRVGAGPFPTKLDDPEATRLRETAREFGTTTGRPRDVGWFDLVFAEHALRCMAARWLPAEAVGLGITKLDCLDGWGGRVRLATAYDLNGSEIYHVPDDTASLARCVPRYAEYDPWSGPSEQCRSFAELDEACRTFLLGDWEERSGLQGLLGVRLRVATAGPQPENALWVDGDGRWLLPE